MSNLNSLQRFELLADLYYERYGRLAPGKSEPIGFPDSNSEENRLQWDTWHGSGLAYSDALTALYRVREELETLRSE